MLAKILVGVVAAIAVTGVGVYYAMPDCGPSACGGHKCPLEGTTVSDGGACLVSCPADAVSEKSPCCSAKAGLVSASNDPLGACVGGMALSTSVAADVKAATHCCEQ